MTTTYDEHGHVVTRVVIELSPDDAQDLYDLLLFRPHDERWSDDVLDALRKAGVEPTPVPYDQERHA